MEFYVCCKVDSVFEKNLNLILYVLSFLVLI